MENVKFDGECHPIENCEDLGYIANLVNEEISEFYEVIDKELQKYAEYLVLNDKEKSIKILTDVMRIQVLTGATPEDYQVIHRPSWMVNCLAQQGSVCLKFKRVKNDNLGKNEHV